MDTIPIKSFTVTFEDGSTRTVEVDDGSGFFREEVFNAPTVTFKTFQAYIAEKERDKV